MGNAWQSQGSPQVSHDPLPALEETAREVTRNPLHVKVVFERLSSAANGATSVDNVENEGETQAQDPKDGNDPKQENDLAQENSLIQDNNPTQDGEPTQDNESSQDTVSPPSSRGAEQVMRVSVQIPCQFHHLLSSRQDRSHVIIVADRSGSMAGNPWKQVQGALADMVSSVLERSDIVLDVVVYETNATEVQFTAQTYKFVFTELKAGGATSFAAAMDKVDQVMSNRKSEAFTSTAVMFLTDGQDTCAPAMVPQRMAKWKTTLQSCGHVVTVHAVGFTQGHDFKFLQEMCEVGTRAGLFRYCEPGDGQETLKMKVQELFEYAVCSSAQTLDVSVEMDGENRVLGIGELLKSHTVEGEILQSDQGDSDVDAGTREITVQTEMWVWVPNASELPSPVVTLSKTVVQNGVHHTVKLPCVCVGVEEKVLDDPASKAMWELSILSRNTDVLATQIANAIRDKKDMTSLQKRLTRFQNRLSNTRVFDKGIKADLRASLMASMKDIQAKMDTMHSMLARYSRGETASVSILARAHDLRYEAQFKKSRRQRMMDKRAVQNVHHAKADEAKLDNLTVDEADIARLSQEAVGFFFCALSQESVVDILRDVANKENAIGFGLAVCRPEYIVDSPTLLQLCLVSGTLVSRTSMLDALEYKVNLAGHLQAHNGFNFFRGRHGGGGDLGYATVGMGREPINAWLPLYVTPSHWQRVKVILKPSLGYLCTLDPLGFDWAQLDVPFALLGAMIGQLNQATVGTHQLRLLLTFLRTCVACVEEFNLTNRILNIVRTFLREPQGRFKNVLPNLYTLIGYIAALPVAQSRKILGYEEEGRNPDEFPAALWYAFLAEMLRRVGGGIFKLSSDRQRNMLVDLVLHGRKNSLMTPNKAQEASCSATQTSSNAAGKVQEASCSATVTTATAGTQEGNASATAAATNESVASSSPSVATTAAGEEEVARLPDLSQQTAAHFAVLCGSMARQDAELTVLEGEGEEGADSKGEKTVTAAEAAKEFPHCPQMDSSMEIWARSKLSGLENRSQEKKVSSATKQVAQWLKEGRQAAGLPDEDSTDKKDEEEEAFDCDTVDSSILEVTAKLLTQLSKSSSLPLSCVPGAVAFLHAWVSKERDLQQMNDGLPPSQWIEEVKVAVDRVYCDMHDYMARCQQQVSNDSVEEVVIVEGETEAGNASGSHRRRGKRGADEASDDEENSDDEDYAHLEEDDPMKVLKRRQQEHRSLVTLPMILHALDPCENQVNVTRAMVCQAVVLGSNTSAKEAVNEGQFLDLKEKDAAEMLMTKLHRHLVRVMTVDQTDSILWRRANVSLLAATNIWAFLGYLMNSYKERFEGFSWLVAEIMEMGEGSRLPCLADKVRVLLTGRWQGHSVLARGNSCMLGRPLCKKLEKVLGEEAWGQIDLELRGDLSIHVYRESDIPNRHGHCNSNPYIPPALRLKLGLPPAGSSK